MRVRAAAPVLVVCFLMLCAEARAQGDDSLGFRAGQWGADFQTQGGFSGAGAIKFTTPTRAWVLDLGGSVGRMSGSVLASSGSSTGFSLSMKVGRRMYGTIAHRVAPWTALGLTAGYGWSRATAGDTVLGHANSFAGGLFGSLGATWLITPHLGVGAQWSALLNYSHFSQTTNAGGTSKSNTIVFSIPNMALAGQLYF